MLLPRLSRRVHRLADRVRVRVPAGIALCIAAAASGAQSTPDAAGRPMPVAFVDDRVFIEVRDASGLPIRFYTDSGGGFNAVSTSIAARLALPQIGTLPGEVGQPPSALVAFPTAMTVAGVPPSDFGGPFQGGLVVVPDAKMPSGDDGFLGARWFDGHVWAFDYGARKLRLLDGVAAMENPHRVALGFQTDPGGRRTTAFARLPIRVGGEALDMLLDTGATMRLTVRSAPVFGRDVGAQVGGSFISESVMRRWMTKHPDWRVVADGDDVIGKPVAMIEVPRVDIAGLSVGPVWFAARPDANFHAFMASMMDRPVEGAIGGSAFRYLKMTIDYPAATASFELPAAKP